MNRSVGIKASTTGGKKPLTVIEIKLANACHHPGGLAALAVRGAAFLRGLSELCNVDGKMLPISVAARGAERERGRRFAALLWMESRKCGLRLYPPHLRMGRAERGVGHGSPEPGPGL